MPGTWLSVLWLAALVACSAPTTIVEGRVVRYTVIVTVPCGTALPPDVPNDEEISCEYLALEAEECTALRNDIWAVYGRAAAEYMRVHVEGCLPRRWKR